MPGCGTPLAVVTASTSLGAGYMPLMVVWAAILTIVFAVKLVKAGAAVQEAAQFPGLACWPAEVDSGSSSRHTGR